MRRGHGEALQLMKEYIAKHGVRDYKWVACDLGLHEAYVRKTYARLGLKAPSTRLRAPVRLAPGP